MFRENTDISSFYIAGINYKKTDASVRGQFSINTDQYNEILQLAPTYGIKEFFILSTCNRTEIYGFAESVDALSELFFALNPDQHSIFKTLSYTRSGLKAVEHLFNVAGGLDSQILGDYEIVGQIKLAVKISKSHSFIGAYLDRMVNEVLQACKQIRTTTALSGGTVSVSFAAVQFVKQHFPEFCGKKILLLGTGKIGRNTCKNIADYLPGNIVTLLNRTAEKALDLALEYNFEAGDINNLNQYVDEADVIIVATNAENAILEKQHFQLSTKKIVIDLSVPCNVSADVKENKSITLVNVDELSKIKDETLKMRALEVPKAKAIIKEHINQFKNWHEMRKHVPVLKAVKSHLEKMQAGNLEDSFIPALIANMCDKAAEEKIQKVINGMAVKMRIQNQRGCQYIEAMNDFISTASN